MRSKKNSKIRKNSGHGSSHDLNQTIAPSRPTTTTC